MTPKHALAMLMLVTAALGCKEDDELPDVDCSGEVPSYSEVTAFEKCAQCHGSELTGAQRQSAPVGIDFDTFEGAEAHATKAAEEVHEGEMPPAGSGITLTADEKDVLYRWALCGAME